MDLSKLKILKNNLENIFRSLVFFTFFLFSSYSFAADSLSYSGRLVKADGSPVAGPVNLTIDLAYTNTPGTILCSQNFSSVALSNGVFHLKLDLVCPGPPVKTLTEILTAVPATFAAALRVSDLTNSKIYSFQEIHSMPFATVSESAKQLAQLGALNGEVLRWNDTTKKWEPSTPGGGGTVSNVTATSPLAVTSGATTPALTITQATTSTDGYLSATDWNTFNNKVGVATGGTTLQFYRGDNSWQTLNTSVVPESGVTNLYFSNARVLGVPLDGLVAGPGAIVATDTVLQAFAKTQGQINLINTNSSAYVTKTGTSTLAAGTIDAQAGFVLVGAPGSINDATPRGYVDTQDNLKVNKAGDTITGVLTLNNDLQLKGGSNYVTLKASATTSAAYDFILPTTAGTPGFVLRTDGAGVLSWIDPGSVASGSSTVNSASITDDSIMNADINSAAAIDQSKIAGLITALGNKVSSTLATGKILVGSTGNVATAVSVSGDAALSDLGTLTLTNTGVAANTYKSVTVDTKGRVTGGTNPSTLAGFGITDTLVTNVTVTAPITITGTTAPLIAMPAATNAVDGYLSAVDRTAFNAKQDAITASSILNSREIRFNELTANGTEYVSLKAPDALTANTTYTLPAADGTTGQVLTTNAAGILSWSTVATSGTNLAGDIGGTIGANTIVTGKVTSNHLLDGTLVNADINAAAAIDYSKLNVPALAVPLTALNATGTKDATKYLKGDNTWSVLQTDVQALLISSYTLGTNAVVATGDSIVSAFGKLQKQITDLTTSTVGGDLTGNLPNPTIAKIQGSPISITTPATKQVLKYNGTTWVNAQVAAADLSATGTVDATTYLAGDNSWKNFNSGVIAAPITGVNTTGITKANSGLVGTDSLLTTFNKLLFTQGDYVSKTANQTINGTLAINSLTGFITVPTPIGATDAANKGYVDSYGQWLEGTGGNINDIYFNTGKVGIGTSTPGEKLDVYAGAIRSLRNTAQFLSLSGGDATNQHHYVQGMSTEGNKKTMYLQSFNDASGAAAGANGFTFQTGTIAAPVNVMTILEGGNVGIGTNTPLSKLNVIGARQSATIKNTIATFDNQAFGIDVGAGLGFGGAVNAGGSLGHFALIGGRKENAVTDDLSGYLVLETRPLGGNLTERMRVTSTGNVGIGTTAPTEALHILRNDGVASGEHWLFRAEKSAAEGGVVIGYQADGTNFVSAKVRSSSGADLVLGTSAFANLLTLKNDGTANFRGNNISRYNPAMGLQLGDQDWSDMILTPPASVAYSSADKGMKTTGDTWFMINTRVPIDPTGVYRVTVRVKKIDGTGTFYVGADSLDANFTSIKTDSESSYNYFAAENYNVAVGSTYTASATISGHNIVGGTGDNRFDPNAKYFNVVIITNYTGTGNSVIEAVEVHKIPTLEPWKTPAMENSWGYYGNGYSPPSYYKDNNGIVHLRGMIAGGTMGTCAFTLPVDYRPAYRILQGAQTHPNAIGRVDVTAAGCVTPTDGSNVWFSLEGVTFRTD